MLISPGRRIGARECAFAGAATQRFAFVLLDVLAAVAHAIAELQLDRDDPHPAPPLQNTFEMSQQRASWFSSKARASPGGVRVGAALHGVLLVMLRLQRARDTVFVERLESRWKKRLENGLFIFLPLRY